LDSAAANLQRGYVIIIDYGRSGDEFHGDIQVRAQHRHLDSPFDEIGHADITMHVDWTSIARRAEANGLRVAGFVDQHHFLTGIISELGMGGAGEPLDGDWRQSPLLDSSKAKRALQTLLHPEMLGRAFQVLALAKNVDPRAPRLSGFQFARDTGSALGLGKTKTIRGPACLPPGRESRLQAFRPASARDYLRRRNLGYYSPRSGRLDFQTSASHYSFDAVVDDFSPFEMAAC
jgi:hypothetical protein